MSNPIRILFALLMASMVACVAHAQAPAPQEESPRQDKSQAQATRDDAAQPNAEQTLVIDAARLLGEGKPDLALERARQAIAGYQARYGDSKQKVYASRSLVETTMYMAEAGNTHQDAIAVEPEYAYAYYFEGFALVDLSRLDEAVPSFNTAVALSPHNAQFLSELGNLYQTKKNWAKALDYYQRAQAASEFSPGDLKVSEQGRALRGIGFVSVELGELDDAEAAYKRCLQLDPNDRMAADELAYVREQRAKAGGRD